jgi:hypothetical protein
MNGLLYLSVTSAISLKSNEKGILLKACFTYLWHLPEVICVDFMKAWVGLRSIIIHS